MNLAALVQSQTLATLLQALAPAGGLVAGRTVEAKLLSVDGDGLATAVVDGVKLSLVLAGPQAQQAALQPGATLVLRFDAADDGEGGLRATLLETRPPGASASTPAPAASTPATQADPRATTPSPAMPGGAVPRASEGAVGPVPAQASSASSPSPAKPVAATTATEPVTAQASPRALAGPLLGQALARQDGLAPLFANLRQVAQGKVAAVPGALLPRVDAVLAQAVPIERRPVTAQVLKDAVLGSGLFLEARQAQGLTMPAQADLKAGLQALRDGLAPLLEALTARPGATPAGTKPPAQDLARLPPPRRDGPLVNQPPPEPSLSAFDTPLTVAKTLLDQTEATLGRIALSQFASLPAEGLHADANQPQRWLTELPLAFQSGTAIMPLQIEREPPRRDAAGVEHRVWRMRFALDVEPMGPLQGLVTLQGRSVAVSLWAERDETSRMLRGAKPALEAALADADFENGPINVSTGQPRVMQPTAGQYLDRLS